MRPRTARIVSRSLLGAGLVMIAITVAVTATWHEADTPPRIVVVPASQEAAIRDAAARLNDGCFGEVQDAALADAPQVYCDLQQRLAEGNTLSPDPFSPLTLVLFVVSILWLATGGLIASRQPANLSGWIFQVIGLCLVAEGMALTLTVQGAKVDPGSVPFLDAWAMLAEYAFLAVALLPLLWLLYPDGRPPTQRWRVGVRLYFAAIGLAVLAFAFGPGPLNNLVDHGIVYMNPMSVPAIAPVAVGLTGLGAITALAIAVASVFGVRARFKRATAEERQQLRWLRLVTTIAAVLLVLAFVGGAVLPTVFGDEGTPVDWWFSILLALLAITIAFGLPGAYLIAIFKHGLWDLDVVIRKARIALVLTLVIVIPTVLVIAVASQLLLWGVTPKVATLVGGVLIGLLLWPLVRLERRLARRLTYGRRASSYEVLSTFSSRVGETYATEDVAPRMAQILLAGSGAASVRVLLRVGGDLHEMASAGSPDGPEHLEPVVFQGEDLGALAVTFPANDPIDPRREQLIAHLAAQAGPVLRNVRLIEELRASRQRLVAAQDEERRKIERNIHDGVQQQLVALQVQLRLARTMVERDPAKAGEMLDALQGISADALDDLRDLARGIYPPLLADKGLGAALEAQARKAAIPVSVSPDGVGRFPQEVEATVYFCVLEALNNVAKYAGATSATVTLERAEGTLRFTVTDDGRGFDMGVGSYGTGLQGMADRLDAIGGSLEVRSAPGEGTTISGWAPPG